MQKFLTGLFICACMACGQQEQPNERPNVFWVCEPAAEPGQHRVSAVTGDFQFTLAYFSGCPTPVKQTKDTTQISPVAWGDTLLYAVFENDNLYFFQQAGATKYRLGSFVDGTFQFEGGAQN